MMQVENVVAMVVSGIFMAIQIWIMVYLFNLQGIKCLCAIGWQWYYIIGYMVLALFMMMYNSVTGGDPSLKGVGRPVQMVLLLLGLFNIYAILSYVYKLKKESCKCSDSAARDVMYALAIVELIFIAIVTVAVIVTLAVLGGKVGKMKKLK